MISQLLAMLDSLQGELFFFVEDGPLKDKLIDRYLTEEDSQGDILDFELDAAVRIKRQEGAADMEIEGRLETVNFLFETLFAIGDFADDEIAELLKHLRPHSAAPAKTPAKLARNILRKKQGSGLLDIATAATTLGLGQQDLKTLIPCSEICITEQEGGEVIKEYYWEKDLIGRFATLETAHKQGRKANREDVTCIAEWCCDGDRQWARDLISEFLKKRHLGGD